MPPTDRPLLSPAQVIQQVGAPQVLVARKNHDRFVERRRAVPKISVTEEWFVRNEWLAESLKSYYTYRCQIFGHSFQAVYGRDFVETHHIHYLHQGGKDVSTNRAVVCPNHHRIIHATDARFNKATLTYEYSTAYVNLFCCRTIFGRTSSPSRKTRALKTRLLASVETDTTRQHLKTPIAWLEQEEPICKEHLVVLKAARVYFLGLVAHLAKSFW